MKQKIFWATSLGERGYNDEYKFFFKYSHSHVGIKSCLNNGVSGGNMMLVNDIFELPVDKMFSDCMVTNNVARNLQITYDFCDARRSRVLSIQSDGSLVTSIQFWKNKTWFFNSYPHDKYGYAMSIYNRSLNINAVL